MSELTLTHDYPGCISFDSAKLNVLPRSINTANAVAARSTNRANAAGTRCTVWTHFDVLLKIHLPDPLL